MAVIQLLMELRLSCCATGSALNILSIAYGRFSASGVPYNSTHRELRVVAWLKDTMLVHLVMYCCSTIAAVPICRVLHVYADEVLDQHTKLPSNQSGLRQNVFDSASIVLCTLYSADMAHNPGRYLW